MREIVEYMGNAPIKTTLSERVGDWCFSLEYCNQGKDVSIRSAHRAVFSRALSEECLYEGKLPKGMTPPLSLTLDFFKRALRKLPTGRYNAVMHDDGRRVKVYKRILKGVGGLEYSDIEGVPNAIWIDKTN